MRKQRYTTSEINKYICESLYKSNKQSMELLQIDKPKNALSLLTATEQLLLEFENEELVAIQSLTYNNLACTYKRIGNLKKALDALTKGIDLCHQYDRHENLAITHLNACAILSQLGDHKKALEHGIKAAFQCQEDLLTLQANPHKHARNELIEKSSLLGISLYNMGIQEEFLGNLGSAIEWHRKACNTVDQFQDIDEKLRGSFYAALEQTVNKLQISTKRRNNFTKTFNVQRSGNRPSSAKNRGMSSQVLFTQRPGKYIVPGFSRPESAVLKTEKPNMTFTEKKSESHNRDWQKTQHKIVLNKPSPSNSESLKHSRSYRKKSFNSNDECVDQKTKELLISEIENGLDKERKKKDSKFNTAKRSEKEEQKFPSSENIHTGLTEEFATRKTSEDKEKETDRFERAEFQIDPETPINNSKDEINELQSLGLLEWSDSESLILSDKENKQKPISSKISENDVIGEEIVEEIKKESKTISESEIETKHMKLKLIKPEPEKSENISEAQPKPEKEEIESEISEQIQEQEIHEKSIKDEPEIKEQECINLEQKNEKPEKNPLNKKEAAIKIQRNYKLHRDQQEFKYKKKCKKNKQNQGEIIQYRCLYKSMNDKNSLLLVLKSLKIKRLSNISLYQIKPLVRLYYLEKQIYNPDAMSRFGMQISWEKVRKNSKGVISEDAQEYFAFLQKIGTDEDPDSKEIMENIKLIEMIESYPKIIEENKKEEAPKNAGNFEIKQENNLNVENDEDKEIEEEIAENLFDQEESPNPTESIPININPPPAEKIENAPEKNEQSGEPAINVITDEDLEAATIKIQRAFKKKLSRSTGNTPSKKMYDPKEGMTPRDIELTNKQKDEFENRMMRSQRLNLEKIKKKSAIKIQKVYKGHIVRSNPNKLKKAKKLKQQKSKCIFKKALKIDNSYYKIKGMLDNENNFELKFTDVLTKKSQILPINEKIATKDDIFINEILQKIRKDPKTENLFISNNEITEEIINEKLENKKENLIIEPIKSPEKPNKNDEFAIKIQKVYRGHFIRDSPKKNTSICIYQKAHKIDAKIYEIKGNLYTNDTDDTKLLELLFYDPETKKSQRLKISDFDEKNLEKAAVESKILQILNLVHMDRKNSELTFNKENTLEGKKIKQNESAIKIQKVYRGHFIRDSPKKSQKELIYQNAYKIENTFYEIKGYFDNILELIFYNPETKKTQRLKIQDFEYENTLKYEDLKQKIEKIFTMIHLNKQNELYFGEPKQEKMQDNKTQSALKIQKVYRGHSVRTQPIKNKMQGKKEIIYKNGVHIYDKYYMVKFVYAREAKILEIVLFENKTKQTERLKITDFEIDIKDGTKNTKIQQILDTIKIDPITGKPAFYEQSENKHKQAENMQSENKQSEKIAEIPEEIHSAESILVDQSKTNKAEILSEYKKCEKSALKIQKVYKGHSVRKGPVGLTKIKARKNPVECIFKKGIQIEHSYYKVKALYTKETKTLEIILYDTKTKKSETRMVENFEYDTKAVANNKIIVTKIYEILGKNEQIDENKVGEKNKEKAQKIEEMMPENKNEVQKLNAENKPKLEEIPIKENLNFKKMKLICEGNTIIQEHKFMLKVYIDENGDFVVNAISLENEKTHILPMIKELIPYVIKYKGQNKHEETIQAISQYSRFISEKDLLEFDQEKIDEMLKSQVASKIQKNYKSWKKDENSSKSHLAVKTENKKVEENQQSSNKNEDGISTNKQESNVLKTEKIPKVPVVPYKEIPNIDSMKLICEGNTIIQGQKFMLHAYIDEKGDIIIYAISLDSGKTQALPMPKGLIPYVIKYKGKNKHEDTIQAISLYLILGSENTDILIQFNNIKIDEMLKSQAASKIQKKYKSWKKDINEKDENAFKSKNSETLFIKGIRKENQYIMVKIILNIEDNDTITIKMGKINQTIQYKLSELFPPEKLKEYLEDRNLLKRILAYNLPKLISHKTKPDLSHSNISHNS